MMGLLQPDREACENKNKVVTKPYNDYDTRKQRNYEASIENQVRRSKLTYFLDSCPIDQAQLLVEGNQHNSLPQRHQTIWKD